MLLQSTGPGQASFLSTQAQIFANWSLNRLSGAFQSTKHKRNHSRNSPSKFSGGLHQQKYWKENLQNGWSRISQIFWPLAICTSNGLNKRKLWKVPLMNVLALYLYTLKNKKVSPKKIHSSILHDFQVAKCIIIISTFNVLTVYWECGASPPTLPSFLPRFSRELLQGSSNFLWGLAWHFAGFPL